MSMLSINEVFNKISLKLSMVHNKSNLRLSMVLLDMTLLAQGERARSARYMTHPLTTIYY